jgi:hypothetical protein
MNRSILSKTSTSSNFSPLLIISVLVFVLGFVTWANSVLIPYLKINCQLNNQEAYLVAIAFYIACQAKAGTRWFGSSAILRPGTLMIYHNNITV